jgi:hypothetical protein
MSSSSICNEGLSGGIMCLVSHHKIGLYITN